MALSWTLDKLGPMCRGARDCQIVFQAIAGRDPSDATSLDFPQQTLSKKRPRLFAMKDSYAKAQPAVRDNFLQSLEILRQFADVEMDVPLPDFPYGAVVGTIRSAI